MTLDDGRVLMTPPRSKSMQERNVWRWVAVAVVIAISMARGQREGDGRPERLSASRSLRNSADQDPSLKRPATGSIWVQQARNGLFNLIALQTNSLRIVTGK